MNTFSSLGGLIFRRKITAQTSGIYYSFSVQPNLYDEPVWALYDASYSVYYNQPDFSFSAPNVYEFDVSDPSNNGYVLSFGTIVDVSDATIESTYVTRTNTPGTTDAKVILNLRDYSGDNLVYFEDTSAGMGYVTHNTIPANTNVSDVTYSWDFRNKGSGSITVNDEINSISASGGTFSNDGTARMTSTDVSHNLDISGDFTCEIYFTMSSFNNQDRLLNFITELDDVNGVLLLNSSGLQHYVSTLGGYSTTFSGSSYNTLDTPIHMVYCLSGGTLYLYIDKTEYSVTPASGLESHYDSGITRVMLGNWLVKGTNVSRNDFYGTFHYFRLWNIALNDADVEQLYDAREIVDYFTMDTTYFVTVSGSPEVFYIDGSANPQIGFSANESYKFDQSDPTNAGQQIVFGYTPDDTTEILTTTNGVTIMGTPGQPGAYTTLDLSSGFVGPLYYYSDGSTNMGWQLVADISHQFTVKTNIYDEPVWALYDETNTAWYNQPELSFSAPNVYEFDVSDPSNNGYVLSFGTTVEVSDASIESTYVTRKNTPGKTDAKVLLDLRYYSGDNLVYFEDTSAGMGYMEEQSVLTQNVLQPDFDPTTVLSVWATNTSNNNFTYTLSGNNTYSFANGTYDISASDIHPNYGLKLNQVLTDGGGSYSGYDWHGSSIYSSSGIAPNTYVTTVDGVDYSGSWIQLSLPYKLQLTQVAVTQRSGGNSRRAPKDVIMVGSNDNGVTFEYIDAVTFTQIGDTIQTINTTTTKSFSLIRMIVETTFMTSISSINLEHWNVIGHVVEEEYTAIPQTVVTVSNEVFYLDGSANPQIDFSANESYVFDQSDPTNMGQQIIFGYTFDDSANILTSADGVTVMGSPGQPGAYTQLDLSSGFVGPLYYYSDGSANMGYAL